MDEQPQDWHAWIERHAPPALLFARQLTACSADADDAVQEGFLRFWRHKNTARDPVALLYACIRTAVLDRRKHEGRRRVREKNISAERPAFFSAGAGDAETRETTEAALAELSEPQRAVVVLKIWADLTLEQIAEALAEAPGTVASRYRSALQKMAGTLRREVPDER